MSQSVIKKQQFYTEEIKTSSSKSIILTVPNLNMKMHFCIMYSNVFAGIIMLDGDRNVWSNLGHNISASINGNTITITGNALQYCWATIFSSYPFTATVG